MTKKHTKSALFTSVMALILCCAMLVGTTLAWFTDSVSTANNLIQSGNLDVELEWSTDCATWVTVDANTNVFNEDALWEPGYTEVVYLRVANVGSLNLKYQLGVNVVSETGSINKAGEPFNLSDYIEYGVVETATKYANREAARAALTDSATLAATYASTVTALAPYENDVVALVVYMPESVDNAANHKTGEVAPQITLGLNVVATQVEAEIDSFGPDYDADADAIVADTVVKTDEELLAAIQNETVKVIAIDGDLTYNWGNGSYENSEALKLKGKTLTGYNGNDSITFAGYGSANPVVDVNLMNITVKDATVGDDENSWEHGYLEFENVTAKNVTFDDSIMLNGNSVINNCEFDNKVSSWYSLWVDGGNATIKNSTFTGTRGIKTHGPKVNSVTVDNCTFELSEKPGIAIGTLSADTTVTIKNSTFINCQPGDQGLYIYETDTDVTTLNFTETNNTVKTSETVSSNDALKTAIVNGVDEIKLNAGEYVMPDGFNDNVNLQKKTLTIKGTKDTVIDVSKVDERDQYVTGATLVFDGVTLNFGTTNYMGFANAASLTYKNCDINGLQFLYGPKVVFENCNLNTNGAEHAVWTWGVQNVTFTDCDFTYGDRAVNCYGENVATTATFNNCTFTKVAGKETTGAIETNSSALTSLNLNINKSSVNEGNLWWVSSYDSEGGAKTYATIDGKVTVATAKQLTATVNAGATDITLVDGEYDVAGCGGKTLTISGSKNAVIKLYNDGEDGCDYAFGGNGTGVGDITFNGVTIDTTANTGSYKGFAYMKGTFNDCNFVGAYSLNNANDFEFNRCTFDFKNGYFWTWGAKSVTFDACTFNGNSKNILAHGWESTTVNIKDCKFNATEKGYASNGTVWTAAVEIDPAGNNTYTINFIGNNTINENYAGWTRIKDDSTGHTITGLN